MKDVILIIDNGTQSIRAMTFDVRGNLINKVQVNIEPYFSIKPGWAEQEPEYFWGKLCQACRQLMQKTIDSEMNISAVGLTSQRSTLVNVDRHGRPLRPAIHWLDQRRIKPKRVVNPMSNLAFKLVKMDQAVTFAYANCESNWIQENQPEIWERTHKYLFLSGYLTYMLTGEFVDSVGCQVGYVPFDFKNFCWAKQGHLNRKIFPMEMEKLPKLVPQTEIMGEITEEASRAIGIPQGTPVIAAAADKACEILGTGSITPDIACLSFGTTCTTSVLTERYVEVIPFIPLYPSAIPNTYNTEIQIFRGFWMVNWFKMEFGHPEIALAQELNVVPETLFDEMIDDIPPGSMGLFLQPYWTPGVKVPGPEAKGAIIGFGDVHTRAHIYRAILEGLAYALREGTEKTVQRTKVPLKSIRISGGGSQSDRAMQITADIFNLPAERPKLYETSGLGAAVDCAVGLGWYSNFAEAVTEMTGVSKVFEPHKDSSAQYEELYKRVYKKMYKNLKHLYHEIKDITGYPEL
ncbi:FGGY-family carbohydrate kinase [candidate division KSB1 bacterium]|nr:FGGY-family carbohydrate kinase [candidate division KSB1 bacterium]